MPALQNIVSARDVKHDGAGIERPVDLVSVDGISRQRIVRRTAYMSERPSRKKVRSEFPGHEILKRHRGEGRIERVVRENVAIEIDLGEVRRVNRHGNVVERKIPPVALGPRKRTGCRGKIVGWNVESSRKESRTYEEEMQEN